MKAIVWYREHHNICIVGTPPQFPEEDFKNFEASVSFHLGFTPHKVKQSLQSMELQKR